MAQEIFKQIRTGNIFSDTYFVRNGGRPSKLDIRRIYSFVNDSLGCIPLSEEILKDLDLYCLYCFERAKIWNFKKAKAHKKTATLLLEGCVGTYSFIK